MKPKRTRGGICPTNVGAGICRDGFPPHRTAARERSWLDPKPPMPCLVTHRTGHATRADWVSARATGLGRCAMKIDTASGKRCRNTGTPHRAIRCDGCRRELLRVRVQYVSSCPTSQNFRAGSPSRTFCGCPGARTRRTDQRRGIRQTRGSERAGIGSFKNSFKVCELVVPVRKKKSQGTVGADLPVSTLSCSGSYMYRLYS